MKLFVHLNILYMLETLLCEQRKGLDVQNLQQEPRLHAFKMSFLGHERCLSTLKYWCKDSWNAPASFWCWSRMRHDHKMNANGITFWAPRWQRSPLDIYSFSAFNSREKNKRQDSAQQFQFTNVSHFLPFLGPCETFAEAGYNRCEKKWNECEVVSTMRRQSCLGVVAGDTWQHQVLISVGGEVMYNISPITEMTLLFPVLEKSEIFFSCLGGQKTQLVWDPRGLDLGTLALNRLGFLLLSI